MWLLLWCVFTQVSPDHFDYWTSTSHHGTGDLIATLGNAASHSGLQPDGGTYWSDFDLMMIGVCPNYSRFSNAVACTVHRSAAEE